MDFSNLQEWAEMAAQALMALVILASVVSRATPTKSDDKKVAKVAALVHKVISYLPTFGVNPKTKELQEWYEKNGPKS